MGAFSSKSDKESNFISTGHSVFVNEKGETVTDSFHNVNGELIRQTEKGKLPLSGGTFMQSTYSTPWVVGAATVLLAVCVLLFISSRRRQRLTKPKVATVDAEKMTSSTALYSLNKPRSHHPSDAMWNIDLLDEAN